MSTHPADLQSALNRVDSARDANPITQQDPTGKTRCDAVNCGGGSGSGGGGGGGGDNRDPGTHGGGGLTENGQVSGSLRLENDEAAILRGRELFTLVNNPSEYLANLAFELSGGDHKGPEATADDEQGCFFGTASDGNCWGHGTYTKIVEGTVGGGIAGAAGGCLFTSPVGCVEGAIPRAIGGAVTGFVGGIIASLPSWLWP